MSIEFALKMFRAVLLKSSKQSSGFVMLFWQCTHIAIFDSGCHLVDSDGMLHVVSQHSLNSCMPSKTTET